MYVFIYIYVCIYIHTCMYVCMYVCIYTSISIYLYIYIYVYTCVCHFNLGMQFWAFIFHCNVGHDIQRFGSDCEPLLSGKKVPHCPPRSAAGLLPLLPSLLLTAGPRALRLT